MRSVFRFTDYKINSRKVFFGTLIAFNIIVLLVTVSEIVVDLRSTSKQFIIPFEITTLFISALTIWYPKSNLLRTGVITLLYLILEVHFVINPTIFHTVIYWFPIIPLVALIIQGLKSSQIWFLIVLISHGFNSFYLHLTTGDRYEITVSRVPFSVMGVIFILGIIATSYLLYSLLGDAYFKMKMKNDELTDLKNQIESKKALLEKYQQKLLDFSKKNFVGTKTKQNLFKNICVTAANTLGVNRVSIWMLSDDRSRIVRNFLYEVNNETDDAVTLERKDYPVYFNAIETKPFIIAAKALEHPDTCGFKDTYLEPLHIFSMLDCPILMDNKTVGVICCENQHVIKEWNTEDSLFLQSLADFIALNFSNDRIKDLLTEVRSKNLELVKQSNEIATMNEELNALNEELTTMNESLEATVKHRTWELETQNQQLTEYAFINSHLLRAPLSRILGLSNLLSKDATSVNDLVLIDALIKSTNELDLIIRKISDILYDGNALSREDIKVIIDRKMNKTS